MGFALPYLGGGIWEDLDRVAHGGGVVDHEALLEYLVSKRLYAAALDVTEPEPLPRDHPILKLDNVIIAPHLGSATHQTRISMVKNSIKNLVAGLNEESLPWPVS